MISRPVRLIRRLLAALIAVPLVAVFAFGASAASAADDDVDPGAVTWMVRPSDGVGEDGRSWIELELDPGETVQEHLLVRNLSSRTVTFRLTAADGYFTESGRFNMLTSDEQSVDAGTWIEIPETVEVPSGADAVVAFQVTVPDNATPGDHPAGVAASIRSGEDEQIGVESRVGFRVMTRVAGALEPASTVRIEGGFTGPWNPFEPGRLEVTYSFTNTGNTRLSLQPEVRVSGLFGLVTMSATGEDIAEIAPGDTRTNSVVFDAVWPLAVFSADVTAPAAVIVSGGETVPDITPVRGSGTIVAIPWAQLITVVVAVILLGWLWIDRRRRDRRLATMLDDARAQGRSEAEAGASRVSDVGAVARSRREARAARAALSVVAGLIAVSAALTPTNAFADVPPTDDGSLRVLVEITPSPTPEPTATSSPDPSPAVGGGQLPATGGTDLTYLVGMACLLVLGGITGLLAHRRRRAFL